MAYTYTNFKTKKALKDAVYSGSPEQCYPPGPSPPMGARDLSNFTGKVYLEGPHFPEPHK